MVYSFDNLPPRSEFLNVKGIYGIKCTVNDKWYVGQSKCIYGRLIAHRKSLRTAKENANRHLLHAFQKYGEASMEIHILEANLNNDELNRAEKAYMDEFKATDHEFGFNVAYFKQDMTPAYRESYHERVKKHPHRYGFADAKVIRELYKEGYSNPEIREKYKTNQNHISVILQNAVWRDPEYVKPQLHERPPLNLEKRIQADRLILQGLSAQTIAERLEVAPHRVYTYLGKQGKLGNTHTCLVLNTITGIYYSSIREAARSMNIPSHLLTQWLLRFPHRNRSDFMIVDSLEESRPPLILDTETGIYYETYTDAAKALNLPLSTLIPKLKNRNRTNNTSLILC